MMSFNPPPSHHLHPSYASDTLRRWQTVGTELHPWNFVLPVFVTSDASGSTAVESMPGVSRYSLPALQEYLSALVAKGLSSVLIFGVIDQSQKDEVGSFCTSPQNPTILAVKMIRENFPDLTVICDVCLCAYTTHGHCGEIRSDGSIDNASSIDRLAKQAVAFGKAGAHVVAPSDMMDGRVGAIKAALFEAQLGSKVSVLSYAVKFSSSLYGPFRSAACSAPSFGDRRCYQLPPASAGLAHRAAARDVAEGADMLMVKPGMFYLDLVRTVKNTYPHLPMFIYQVSGEYSMLLQSANNGLFDLKKMLYECFTSMRRSGADVIISYFTPKILEFLKEDSAATFTNSNAVGKVPPA